MKKTQSVVVSAFAAILIITFAGPRAANASMQRRFAVTEYDLFYEQLHILQHDALPRGDFRLIRLMATELVIRGRMIVKIRMEKREGPSYRTFTEARRKFDRALNAFRSDARKDSDSRLSRSFTAVHDSFEELADAAAIFYWPHPPPVVTVSCTSDTPEPRSELIVRAVATPGFDARKRKLVWTLSGGKIVNGQGTRKLTVDTTGQAGQRILVTLEVNDGNGWVMSASCLVQIAAGKQP